MNEVVRETRETRVRVACVSAARGIDVAANTSVPFLDHMLVALARYAGLGLNVEARGDLRHHIIEDVAITVGSAIRQTIPSECARYGHSVVPMDDALVEATIDLVGRRYYKGPLPSSLYDHWMRSFAEHSQCTLHIRVLRGRDRHHIVEAAFKALGFALQQAMSPSRATLSTKGTVQLRDECSADA
jgi:imidazoleglycerol-phosphate dehydratase